MNTDVKIFHSQMVGAPAKMSNLAGTALAVLDACLVNGFGLVTASSVVIANGVATMNFPSGHSFEKYTVALVAGATPAGLNGEHRIIATTANSASFEIALADQTATGTITAKVAPAGWEKPFSATNIGVFKSLKPSATGCYFRVDDSTASAYSFTVDGYETMADSATGTGLFQADYRYFLKTNQLDATLRPWMVIANGSMVYVGISNYTANGTYGYQWGCFGDIKSRKSNDAYRAFIRGNHNANTAVNPQQSSSVFYGPVGANYGCLARDFTGVSGARKAHPMMYPDAAGVFGGSASGAPYPNGADYSLLLQRVHVLEPDRTIRGWMPGMVTSPQNLLMRITTALGTPLVFLTNIPDMPGSVLLVVPVSVTIYSSDIWCAGFFDIGLAWGN
jgi:hypothetical protein